MDNGAEVCLNDSACKPGGSRVHFYEHIGCINSVHILVQAILTCRYTNSYEGTQGCMGSTTLFSPCIVICYMQSVVTTCLVPYRYVLVQFGCSIPSLVISTAL